MSFAPRRANSNAGHLVGPVRGRPIGECLSELQEAHDFLASAGQRALELKLGVAVQGWGATCKRLRVQLKGRKPGCVGSSVEDQNLIEVINQCATLERMLDALEWATKPESGFCAYDTVVVCHPSTSSSNDGQWENDLVLRTREGLTARFEVSDVASATNSNGKRERDLKSLRIVDSDGAVITQAENTRCFVVVSEEFCSFLLKSSPSWIKTGAIRYHLLATIRTTRILEVMVEPK